MLYIYLADIVFNVSFVFFILACVTGAITALFVEVWQKDPKELSLKSCIFMGSLTCLLALTLVLIPSKQGIYLMVGHELATQTGTYEEAGETLSLVNKYIKIQIGEH